MFLWILAGILAVSGIALLTHRRSRRNGDSSMAEDLFEGLLPSAATGHADRPPENNGWGLRWADAVNLTPDTQRAAAASQAVRAPRKPPVEAGPAEPSPVGSSVSTAEAAPSTSPPSAESSPGL